MEHTAKQAKMSFREAVSAKTGPMVVIVIARYPDASDAQLKRIILESFSNVGKRTEASHYLKNMRLDSNETLVSHNAEYEAVKPVAYGIPADRQTDEKVLRCYANTLMISPYWKNPSTTCTPEEGTTSSTVQQQQVVDPIVNSPPTEQELLEYRVTMERLTSQFREQVQVYGQGVYAKLIHELKVTISKFNSDLVEADEWKVMQSIRRCDSQHFKQGFMVKVRSITFREQHPEFTAKGYDTKVHTAICKLHLLAADMSQKMADIHYNLALIKTKVSPSDFNKISSSIPLPLTTVEIVDPAQPSTVDIHCLHICDHMLDPSKLLGNKATRLLRCTGQVPNAKYSK